MSKVTGEPKWTSWIFVPSRFAVDVLLLLGHRAPLYLSMHEWKDGRTRRVRGVTLETTPPEED